MRRTLSSLLILALAPVLLLPIAGSAVAEAAIPVLEPQRSVDLAPLCDPPVGQVAWRGPGEILLTCPRGVVAVSLPKLNVEPVLPPSGFPEGLPGPDGVAVSGQRVLAWAKPFQQYLWDGGQGKRVWARQRPDFMVMDALLSEDRQVLLGWWQPGQGPDVEGVAVWQGPAETDFSQLAPVHSLPDDPKIRRNFRAAWSVYGGALAADGEGGFAVVTTVAPGVHRYDAQGRRVEVLGRDLDELVVADLHRAISVLSKDVPGRYQGILNRQPMPDDLVWTAAGPAIVVRRSAGEDVVWELWFPGEEGVERRLRLATSRRPNAHMDCDTLGDRLACVYSDLEGDGDPWEQREGRVAPRLVLFDLDTVE